MKNQKNELSEEQDMEDMEDEQESTYQKVRRISITLPEDIAKEAEKYAKEHKLKRSQVIALALEKGLGDEDRIIKQLNRIETLIRKNSLKQPSKINPSEETVLSDEQRAEIKSLLEYCSPSSNSFEIEGDEAFLAQVQKRGLTGSIWTDEMLDIFATKLSIAYENYFITPDAQTLIDRCSEAMELSEDQKNQLMQYFTDRVEGLEYTPSEQTGDEE